MTDYEEGIIIAAVNIVNLYDEPGIAAGILKDSGLVSFDCSEYSEYDKKSFRKINDEVGMNLMGL